MCSVCLLHGLAAAHPACSIQQRASILQQLLQDRDTSVADAGRSMLAHWLEEHCGGDPLQLLQHLDVETYTGECKNDSHVAAGGGCPQPSAACFRVEAGSSSSSKLEDSSNLFKSWQPANMQTCVC
jgi:hypothetical protein